MAVDSEAVSRVTYGGTVMRRSSEVVDEHTGLSKAHSSFHCGRPILRFKRQVIIIHEINLALNFSQYKSMHNDKVSGGTVTISIFFFFITLESPHICKPSGRPLN